MKNSLIRSLVVFGVLCIASIIGIQSWWFTNNWNMQDQEFDQTVRIALINVATDLEAFSSSMLPNDDLVTRMSSNYYIVNINGNINPSNLTFFLKKRLSAAAISEDFEFGIFDCHNRKMVYGQYIKQEPNAKPEALENPLPTYDKLTYYFGIRFPDRTGYLFAKMRVTIMLSLILICICVFFAYALFIILQQKRLSELQKDFINNMTHEFKTPISTIKISSDVLLKSAAVEKDPRLLRYTSIIKEQNERLNNQVEKVLQLAKIEEGSLALKLEKVELNQFIRNLMPSMELKAQGRKGTLHTKLSTEPLFIEADLMHLTNILHNLVDNAVKYCSKSPLVHISTHLENGIVHFKVKDNGIGIAKEHQKTIFTKFFRAPVGNLHDVKGFGLGLFYLKNICDQHKWQIKVESELNKGTTFEVIIPALVKHYTQT